MMIVTGLVKFYNEGTNGNLERCLKQMSTYCNHIICCNDSSTDNSLEIANKYTQDIITKPNDFKAELQHKQSLLDYLYKNYPKTDIIVHLDPDECFNNPKLVEEYSHGILYYNFGGTRVHLLNLWLSERHYRIDNQFNGLWKTCIWRNTGDLKYPEKKLLHQPMHPPNIKHVLEITTLQLQILHYGFSTKELIARKYKTYQSVGQSGWNLERLSPVHEAKVVDLYSGIKSSKKISKKEWKRLLKKVKI